MENINNLKTITTAPKAGYGYDSELLSFVKFVAGFYKNIKHIYIIINHYKAKFDYCLQDEYDNFYTERCTFEFYKENFVELLMQDLFVKCYDEDLIETHEFYLKNEKLSEDSLYDISEYFNN
jgi:hypothetical protein